MLAQWIADLVGKMHKSRITKTRLAEELGVTREYVSMVLNGHQEPAGVKEARDLQREHGPANTLISDLVLRSMRKCIFLIFSQLSL